MQVTPFRRILGRPVTLPGLVHGDREPEMLFHGGTKNEEGGPSYYQYWPWNSGRNEIFFALSGDHPIFFDTYQKRYHTMNKEMEDPIIDLYRESFPHFARMVRRMGGSLEEAKDAFHDALLIYIEKERAGTLRLNRSPKAYVLGTAKICWLRERGGASMVQLPDGFGAVGADEENEDVEEREKSLLRSLVRSGRKCMELLKAFYYEHCSMDDIAERFGFSGRRSATVQKYKCLEKVREEIKSIQAYAQ